MKKIKKTQSPIRTNNNKIICDGGEGDLGHPKIYLAIDESNVVVVCPYCGKKSKKS